MTKLLEKAFDEASKLPASEQDSVAKWLLEELHSEARWAELFESSPSALERLANEALAEHDRGETENLDPDSI